ncbi:MAG: TlpA family protein disulfide reductase [Acidimicrobiales bacterium]
MTPRRRAIRAAALIVAAVVVLGACSSGDDAGTAAPTTAASPDGLVAVAASFDVAVGRPRRFLVGLFSEDHGNVGYGTVEFNFSYLGTDRAEGDPRPGPSATASFLPVPGSEPPTPPPGPAFLRPSEGRGVYAADAGFGQPGIWEVEVTADLVDGGTVRATSLFEVLPAHRVPAEGDVAPQSENLTVDSPGVPMSAIDSRASDVEPVPDPELHGTTIAEAVRTGRPALVVFSTPTFCVSRFCGPVTDMVGGLAADYADRASFIHVEVWRDFEAQQLNDTAAEWLTPNGAEGNEPWVFLIGADGRIAARWDNVATPGEITAELERLPVIGPASG